MTTNLIRLRDFVTDLTRLVESLGDDEPGLIATGRELLGRLIAEDDWLPDACARPDPARYLAGGSAIW